MRSPSRACDTTPAPSASRPPADSSAWRRISNRRMPGTDGGSVGISKTRRPSRASSSVSAACGSLNPEHRRQRDVIGRLDQRRQARAEAGAPTGIVEAARESERVGVGTVELDVDADSASRRSLRVAGSRRRARRGSRAAAGSRRRRRRRAACVPAANVSGTSADGLSAPTAVGSCRLCSRLADVGVAGQRAARGGRREPVDGRVDVPGTEQRVGMLGRAAVKRRDRLARRVDPLRRVAEHVDRARGQVRRADALGDDADVGAAPAASRAPATSPAVPAPITTTS